MRYNEAVTGKQMVKFLKANGWRIDRIRGSHHQMVHAEYAHSVTVPVHGKQELAKWLERDILKQARLM